MNSSLYVGRVRHRRYGPVPHAFSYRLFMLCLDLDELPDLFRGRWLWSARRPALARYAREDHLGDPRQPLADAVRDLVGRETGRRPAGPIRLLTHLRYFGYCFNPVSFYYCFDPAGERVETVVAEVNNTPWGERHCYVLPAPPAAAGSHRHRFGKHFHVSPFMPMDMDYDWTFGAPGERLGVHMRNLRDGVRVFDATLALERRAITPRALAAVLATYPLMTLQVVAAIHWQALRLWLKRCPVHDHPARRVTAGVAKP